MKYLILILMALPSLGWSSAELLMEAGRKDIPLTKEQKEILLKGKISEGRENTSKVLGIYPGVGLGHLVQGRYKEKGWIFTVGEYGSLFLMTGAGFACHHRCSDLAGALAWAGFLGFIGFKIWEIKDVWAGPAIQNKKYKEVRDIINNSPEKPALKTSLRIVPLHQKFGQGAALSFSF